MTGTVKRRSVKRKKWLWVLLILAAAAVFGVFRLRGTVRPGYEQSVATARDIATYYTFSGKLTPVTDETQTAKDALKVKEVYASEGEPVREGEPLLRATDGTRVAAKVSGIVETLFVEADDTLQPGGQIARIVDYDRLEVSVDVDEYDIEALSIGKRGQVYINARIGMQPDYICEISSVVTNFAGEGAYAVAYIEKEARGRP